MARPPQFIHARTVSLYPVLRAQFDSLIAHYRALPKTGWTVADVWEMTQSFVASVIQVVKVADAAVPAETIKELALDTAGDFYDQVIAPIDIPGVPAIIENNLVDPKIRSLVLQLVGGAVDSLLKVFSRPQPVGAGPGTITPPVAPAGFIPY